MRMELYQLMWLLVSGSFLGYLLEMLWYRKLRGKWVNRKGVIYGLYSPIYGFAMAGFWLIFRGIRKKRVVLVFLLGSLLGSSFEYFCGFLQEKIFGTKSWDYSKKPFQIKGRICLEFAIYWGIAAITVNYLVAPVLFFLLDQIREIGCLPLVCAAFLLLLADGAISVAACLRQRFRRWGKTASNKVEKFLDRHYPDERLDSIFTEIRILDKEDSCESVRDFKYV